MLFKSRKHWWDRDCFMTIFTFYFSFYTPVSSHEFSNSGTPFFALIVWPNHFPLYPKHLRSSSLPQQKYYPLLSQHARNSWGPNFNKTYLSKTHSNSLFHHKFCTAYWAHRQTSSKTLPTPYATRLTLKLTMCNSSSESVSFLARALFLSLVQQLIWQLIFRFGSALPQQNPEDDELTGEGIRFI